jgi:hypothetical protein
LYPSNGFRTAFVLAVHGAVPTATGPALGPAEKKHFRSSLEIKREGYSGGHRFGQANFKQLTQRRSENKYKVRRAKYEISFFALRTSQFVLFFGESCAFA